MSKKRKADQLNKQKSRAIRFNELGGEGNSKYRRKQTNRKKGIFQKTSPFYERNQNRKV